VTPDQAPWWLRLPDGRRLAVAEYGDPRGEPVLYCHGFPSSRREAQLIEPAARAEGARLIAPDRPGYGDSDPLPRRSIADWADDVAALADHLGLPRVALVGVSGGGPYALACAQRIPDRLSACALVCPLGPVHRAELLATMHPAVRAMFVLPHRAPHLSSVLLSGPAAALLSIWPQGVEHLRSLRAPPADRAALARPEVAAILNDSIRDAMRNGAAGALQDLTLYTEDWGIDFASARTEIDLWHGEVDGTVPVAHSRWYAAHLPSARLHLLANEGHFSLPLRHGQEILRTLLDLRPAQQQF
jgi:pimeloyl-ACP methyl ester carboxylesterase